jgi:hypothetical protein
MGDRKMTREIKFRGKRRDTGEWIYGSLCQNQFECMIMDWNAPDYGRYEVEVDSIGQFTGRTDGNDQEIYETDILEWDNGDKNSPKQRAEVFFDDYYKSEPGYYLRGKTVGMSYVINEWYPTVIGNTFENPELLNA